MVLCFIIDHVFNFLDVFFVIVSFLKFYFSLLEFKFTWSWLVNWFNFHFYYFIILLIFMIKVFWKVYGHKFIYILRWWLLFFLKWIFRNEFQFNMRNLFKGKNSLFFFFLAFILFLFILRLFFLFFIIYLILNILILFQIKILK